MSHNFKNWPIVTGLTLVTIPIMFMYVFLFVDTVTDTLPGEMIPNRFTLEHWRFLWENIEGKASVWLAMLNTMIFASSVTLIVLSVSSTASYALSRLNIPFRKERQRGIPEFPKRHGGIPGFPRRPRRIPRKITKATSGRGKDPPAAGKSLSPH